MVKLKQIPSKYYNQIVIKDSWDSLIEKMKLSKKIFAEVSEYVTTSYGHNLEFAKFSSQEMLNKFKQFGDDSKSVNIKMNDDSCVFAQISKLNMSDNWSWGPSWNPGNNKYYYGYVLVNYGGSRLETIFRDSGKVLKNGYLQSEEALKFLQDVLDDQHDEIEVSGLNDEMQAQIEQLTYNR